MVIVGQPKWYETGDPEDHGVISSEEPLHDHPSGIPHHDYMQFQDGEYTKGHEEDPSQWNAWEPEPEQEEVVNDPDYD